MTFEEILDQAIAMLQRRRRLTYRTLKRQFDLNDEALEDLKVELIKGQQLALDEDGEVLIWTGPSEATTAPAAAQDQTPLTYTPLHLAEKILHSKAALEGERKQVTVLFADIKGSTELIAGLDPEEARQILDPVLQTLMEAVHRYEGTVNQVLGDGIMALFGAPLAHEDHAVRACYAALAMQEAIRHHTETIRRSHGIEVQIRVGLNSGSVVVRAIGNDLHMDYSAIGQTTHLAARMEQLATPGSIRLTGETLRLVEGLVQVKPLGPIPVKGMPEPVAVFELIGASTRRRRLQARVIRGLTRFVGRQTELETLHQALERVGAGHGQVVAVIGEPGVGKSRLYYEFTHSHHTQGWLILESSAVSYGQATPYLPAVDVLKRYFRIEDRDEERQIREKITGKLLTLDTALQPTVPAFLALLDVSIADPHWEQLDPSQRRQRILDACKRLLLRESQVQPLLVVFENLHWIDTETQAFLDSVIDSLPTAQILLLVNYRPEYQHGWGSRTYYTQLRLDPLPPASAEEFLQDLLGDDASLIPLKPLLIERTQGNPFFLEESVRTLVEMQVLLGERGVYRLMQPLQTIQVPATVQAVLAARIDRLPPEEKRLLQTAAVIGTDVPFALLQAIADLPEEALRRGLTHLQAAEFLYETRLFPHLEYTFKHALTHQVTYESLLQERRRMLHARTMAALEALAGDRLIEQIERLAHHARRGERWDKALSYCRQAGAKAYARAANREAVAYWEQALEAVQHLPEHRDLIAQAIDLRFDLRHALMQLLEMAQIFQHLCAAETLAQALEDQRRLGWVSAYLTSYFRSVGDYDRALASGQRALALATSLGDIALQSATNLYVGQTYYFSGDYRQAMAFERRNVESLTDDLSYERFGQAGPPSVFSRAMLVSCHTALGEFPEGIARGEEAIRIAEAMQHPYNLIAAYGCIGFLYLQKGELPKAIAMFERSQSLSQSVSLPSPWNVVGLGYAYALSDRLPDALSLLEQGVEQYAARGVFYHLGFITWLSEAYLLAGRIEEALAQALHALKLSRAHKARGFQVYALQLLGEIYAHRDPPVVEQAEDSYQQGLVLANELGMRPLQAHCHRGLGLLYRTIGQKEQARTALSIAIDLYRSMEMTFWLPQTEEALTQVEDC